MPLRDVLTSFTPKSLPHNLFADPHPLNPLTSILYKNSGGQGYPQLSHRSSLSPIFRTLFQVPYPASPLLATLAKTAGGCTNNSHSGTHLTPRGVLGAAQPSIVQRANGFLSIPILFTLLRTLLHAPKTQLFYFQAIAHSLQKTTRVGCPCRSYLSRAGACELEDPGPVGTAQDVSLPVQPSTFDCQPPPQPKISQFIRSLIGRSLRTGPGRFSSRSTFNFRLSTSSVRLLHGTRITGHGTRITAGVSWKGGRLAS